MTDRLWDALRQGLAERERFEQEMEAAGWRLTHDVHLRAFLSFVPDGLPGDSKFSLRGSPLRAGDELIHRDYPDLPIKRAALDDVWLPPWPPEITEEFWMEVVRLALWEPVRFQQKVQEIEEVDLQFNISPP